MMGEIIQDYLKKIGNWHSLHPKLVQKNFFKISWYFLTANYNCMSTGYTQSHPNKVGLGH